MSNIDSENLINLSEEDNEQITNENYIKLPAPLPLIASPEGRLSFDNNPFDLVQKLSICRQDDPFDVVEKEASLKARQSFSRTTNDVKIANLLSLSDDSEFHDLDNVQDSAFSNCTIYESAEANDLENESPPITVSTKWTPDSSTAESGGTGLSCDSSDSNSKQSNGTRNRKQRHYRNRLLKISLSNSTYSTPMSSRRLTDDGMKQDILSMDIQNEELAAESPLKSMYEDVLEQLPSTYTEKDFDADLELMKIPMLNQIKSPCPTMGEQIRSIESQKTEEVDGVGSQHPVLPHIESIRLKLHAKRSESNNNHDIQDLINNLKTVICESKEVDEHKKDQVSCLLETLSSTLNTVTPNTEEPVPQVIKRQATFNYDPSENSEHHGDEMVDNEKANHANSELNGLSQQPMEEIPDVMMRSSATYDGETAEDKEYLNLPQIDPPSSPKEQSIHPHLNDIMEQLQYLLEQHQIGSSKPAEDSSSKQTNGLSAVANNPTFIVVMPTISHEESKNLCENNEISASMRRRSQSLSIHDKLKIVQLPIKPSPDTILTDTYESPPLSASNSSTVGTDSYSFKTPARFLPRRNSFSSATPYTPMRYSRFNNSTLDKGYSNGSSEAMLHSIASPVRRRSILDTHNESQSTQRLPRPQLGLMKPDPKKKVIKTTQSIVKSNGPLKATIPLPVKKSASNVKPNTSMHLVAKSGFMSNTSTPMPDIASKTIPNAWSTPTEPVPSPGKLATHSARYSNISTTPIGKTLAVPTAPAAGFRRRTISELKTKSPAKTRSNAAISGVSSASALTKPNVIRSNLLRPTTNSRISMNTRSSATGTSAYLANRYKENKKP